MVSSFWVVANGGGRGFVLGGDGSWWVVVDDGRSWHGL